MPICSAQITKYTNARMGDSGFDDGLTADKKWDVRLDQTCRPTSYLLSNQYFYRPRKNAVRCSITQQNMLYLNEMVEFIFICHFLPLRSAVYSLVFQSLTGSGEDLISGAFCGSHIAAKPENVKCTNLVRSIAWPTVLVYPSLLITSIKWVYV